MFGTTLSVLVFIAIASCLWYVENKFFPTNYEEEHTVEGKEDITDLSWQTIVLLVTLMVLALFALSMFYQAVAPGSVYPV